MPSEKKIEAATYAILDLVGKTATMSAGEIARVALTAAEQAEPATDAEPVAWLTDGGPVVTTHKWEADIDIEKGYEVTPLYTSPQPDSRLREALEALLKPFENDPCRLDHHGYCQAHFIEEDCSVAKARKILAQEPKR